ncbi:1,3-beta-galactosyl-N-acetylhexosamine phosphorylase N-terminal domain-containing protein, partial [Actinoplanes campanulatus]|uniref:1,3-beta-galactosyl-N-acetylhexosamine phosphorylase N-terminal domain-containing protein n=1 Tax=Actinoplanes campanulatus TaxID=113559 RepID=UPI0016707CBD
MIPLTIIRLFENGRPRRPQFVGNRGSTRSHCSSVIASNRDFSFTPPVSRDPHLTYRRHTLADGELSIDLMTNWFVDQVYPDTDCDVERWWQVIDRTTGDVIA